MPVITFCCALVNRQISAKHDFVQKATIFDVGATDLNAQHLRRDCRSRASLRSLRTQSRS